MVAILFFCVVYSITFITSIIAKKFRSKKYKMLNMNMLNAVQ